MSENTIIFSCGFCDHTGVANEFMPGEHPIALECANRVACERRQKRDLILLEMQEMAKKPHVHPVDRFTRLTVVLCGFFMGAVSAISISYLLFGI